MHVQERRARVPDALPPLHVPEQQRDLRVGVAELDQRAIRLANPVLQAILVEFVVAEHRQRGVHSVLHAQQLRLHPRVDEALEQRDVVPRSLADARQHDGLQLLLIADQHHALRAVHDGDQRLALGGLRGLVHQHRVEHAARQQRRARAVARGHHHVRALDHAALELPVFPEESAPFRLADLLAVLSITSLRHTNLVPRLDVQQLGGFLPHQLHRLDVHAELLHGALHVLFGDGHEPHHVHAGPVDASADLIGGHVRGRAHQHGAGRLEPPEMLRIVLVGLVLARDVADVLFVPLHEVVHQRGRSD